MTDTKEIQAAVDDVKIVQTYWSISSCARKMLLDLLCKIPDLLDKVRELEKDRDFYYNAHKIGMGVIEALENKVRELEGELRQALDSNNALRECKDDDDSTYQHMVRELGEARTALKVERGNVEEMILMAEHTVKRMKIYQALTQKEGD